MLHWKEIKASYELNKIARFYVLFYWNWFIDCLFILQYGIKKKEEKEAEAQAAMEAQSEGSLTRPKKAIPAGCGDEEDEEEESILDTVIKYLPGPLQDMFKK